MKNVYIISRIFERIGYEPDNITLGVYENEHDALEEAKARCNESLKRAMHLEGMENVCDDIDERSHEKIGIWSYSVYAKNYILTYRIKRYELR